MSKIRVNHDNYSVSLEFYIERVQCTKKILGGRDCGNWLVANIDVKTANLEIPDNLEKILETLVHKFNIQLEKYDFTSVANDGRKIIGPFECEIGLRDCIEGSWNLDYFDYLVIGMKDRKHWIRNGFGWVCGFARSSIGDNLCNHDGRRFKEIDIDSPD